MADHGDPRSRAPKQNRQRDSTSEMTLGYTRIAWLFILDIANSVTESYRSSLSSILLPHCNQLHLGTILAVQVPRTVKKSCRVSLGLTCQASFAKLAHEFKSVWYVGYSYLGLAAVERQLVQFTGPA